MSLLRQDSEQLDDAALGEELTKGTGHRGWATVIAAVFVSLAIALYFIAGQHPPLASGEVSEVWVHPLQGTTSAFDANGAPKTQESFENMLVFVRIKLQNDSEKPLYMVRIKTNLTLPDGVHTSYAATLSDYDRVFIAYPQLTPFHNKGLSPQASIEPWKAIDGTFVSSFRITKQEWDARKDLNFVVDFRYQPSLTLTPRSAPVQR